MRLPELIAHRGYALRYPENTRSAIAGAIAAGARFVEVDVQLSSDRVPYLFHDRSLERMCGVGGALHERSSAELAALRASQAGTFGKQFSNEPLARLGELVGLLAANRGVHAFVELKRVSIERFGAAEVLDAVLALLDPVREQCALISFSIETLIEARRRSPLPMGAVLERWEQRSDAALRSLRPEYVFADVLDLPAEGRLEVESGALAVYEVPSPELALLLAERGARYVETFAIGELLQAFARLDPGSA